MGGELGFYVDVKLGGVFFVGLQVSGDVVERGVLTVVLVLLEAISSLGFSASFLFSRVMLCLVVTSSPMVGWLMRRGCCGMWLGGMYGYCYGVLFMFTVWYG